MAGDPIRFDGRVVVVTGAGNGLGKEYAIAFGERGAKVVVNDLGGDIKGGGQSSRPADLVVDEIRSKGGIAVANYDSVEFGDRIVKTALDNFGRIDILINNAGILRDRSFARISDDDWDIIQKIHLRSVFVTTRAAWPHMKDQNFGRIIMVSSAAGIYGNFGQTNYSAAKLGVVGFMNTLAIEGQKNNVLCNTIAPFAGSRLTATVMPPNLVEIMKPEYVAPLVLWLSHESFTGNGGLYECGAGIINKVRWQRSKGVSLRIKDVKLTPEAVRNCWDKVIDFSSDSENPASIAEANAPFFKVSQELDGVGDSREKRTGKRNIGPNQTSASNMAQAIGTKFEDVAFSYTERDSILYALGVGVSTRQSDHLKFLFEMNSDFCVLPTYAVIPAMRGSQGLLNVKGLQINPTMILHGEQYLELYKPLLPSAALTISSSIVDVLDKGSGAVIVCEAEIRDERGEKVSKGQSVIFVQKAGGFGGKRASDKIVPLVNPPDRKPDAIVEEITSVDQAALYRLSGDNNPLHIDPDFSALGGFPKPILHGLCSFGYATRHVLKQYCNNDVTKFKSIKVRFSNPVLPGQTIRTDMWRVNNRIIIQCTVVETGKPCLTGAYVDLHDVITAAGSNSGASSGLKSEEIFRKIELRIKANPQMGKAINALYLFNITSNDQIVAQYTADLTSGNATIYVGKPTNGKAPDCTLTASDDDFADLVAGQTSGLQAFTAGRIKVEGNVMLTFRLEALFKELSKL